MKISKKRDYENWWDFLSHIDSISNYNFVFRGHSNYQPPAKNIKPWNLISSFNRNYPGETFHLNKLSEFAKLQEYCHLYRSAPLNFRPEEYSLLEMMQFLQHYGVPTPLMDFSIDPLVALYFAVSGIPTHTEKQQKFKNENRYITIIQLNLKELEGILGYMDITPMEESAFNQRQPNEREFDLLIREYTDEILEDKFKLGIVSQPNIEINPNLQLQKGMFIYYDSNLDLEEGIMNLVKKHYKEVKESKKKRKKNKKKDEEAIITYHNIPYKSIFVNDKNNCINIYAYLMHKNKIGVNLFENDMQGLKYDLNNGDLIYTLGCINKYFDCNCLETLKENGIKM